MEDLAGNNYFRLFFFNILQGYRQHPCETFDSLTQKEILALAISLEEEDERIYSDYGENLRENLPATAQVFEEMRREEIGHRRWLIVRSSRLLPSCTLCQ